VNGKKVKLTIDTRTTLLDAFARSIGIDGYKERV
jgi:aerobic-type carbon monoxide dehydrogenase small subunit (CoxS/CutS family)